jgi:hypothetical protein
MYTIIVVYGFSALLHTECAMLWLQIYDFFF